MYNRNMPKNPRTFLIVLTVLLLGKQNYLAYDGRGNLLQELNITQCSPWKVKVTKEEFKNQIKITNPDTDISQLAYLEGRWVWLLQLEP